MLPSVDRLRIKIEFLVYKVTTPIIFLETDRIILFCSSLSSISIAVCFQILNQLVHIINQLPHQKVKLKNRRRTYILLDMRHFRAEGEETYLQEELKLTYNQKLYKSLKSITRLLPFVQFTVNYGFAIENVWVTMLMITHKTPDQVDSFVWITPIVIAILIRPYIVRYVHNINFKVYREISMVSLFLMLGAIGCFLVGLSCELDRKSQMIRRIIQCAIGWTLMDLSFEFCQFFSQKIDQSYKQLHGQEQPTDKEKQSKEQKQQSEQMNKKENFQFYGLFLGYVVSLLICWIIHGRTVKEFYKCCKYAYWTVAGLDLITGSRLYIESYLNLPKSQDNQQRLDSEKPGEISHKLPYYLPGLPELIRSDRKTFLLLILHFVIVFLNDVVVIYATMWFSEPAQLAYSKHGEALIAGLQYGSIALLVYTIIDNLKIKKKILSIVSYFEISLILVVIASVLAFYKYNYLFFTIIAVSVGILNQFYRHTVYNNEYEENPVFERCIEIVERAEKISVLAVMPSIILLGLDRDDIPDCLYWSAGMGLLGLICYIFAKKIARAAQSESKGNLQIQKVTKIE